MSSWQTYPGKQKGHIPDAFTPSNESTAAHTTTITQRLWGRLLTQILGPGLLITQRLLLSLSSLLIGAFSPKAAAIASTMLQEGWTPATASLR